MSKPLVMPLFVTGVTLNFSSPSYFMQKYCIIMQYCMVQAVIYEHYTQLFIIIIYRSPRYINKIFDRLIVFVGAFICASVRLHRYK